MLEKFLAALPAAASSPYAFISYLCLIATVTYTSIAQFRLRTIARIINTLPEKDRGALLKKEYNVLPANGLTADQWIRSRRQMLIFWFLIALVASAIVIAVIAVHEIPAQAAAADAAKQRQLVAFWQSEQIRLEGLLRDGQLSQDSYTTIIASLNALSAKLANPSTATADYTAVANQITSSLEEGRYRLSSNKIENARIALSSGAPSVAKSILKDAAARDISSASDALYQIGLLSEQEANYSDADLYYKKALDLSPDNPKYLDAYEITQTLLGHYSTSEQLLTHTRDIEQRRGTLTADRSRQLNFKLAYVYLVSNRFQQAETIYLSIKLEMETEGDFRTLKYAFLLNNLGSLYHNWGRYNEASGLLASALDLLTAIRGENDTEVAKVLSNTAYLKTLLANYDEVPALLDRAIAIFVQRYAPRNAELINPLNNYARYYTARGRFQDSDRMLAEARAIGDLRFGGKHPWLGRTFDLIAERYLAESDFDNACKATTSALELKELFFGTENLEMARTLKLQAQCQLGLGLESEAKNILNRARDIVVPRLGPENIRIAEIDAVFSDYYLKVHEIPQAAACVKLARDIADRQLGALHPFSVYLASKLSTFRSVEPAQASPITC
ncbi:tetratricopeptide repeat protein [Bradyrhizobium sp. STM 3809]|uniref:tetratricopeptide repeat protein n=1 Tax=Bradyrhizobium sp. STM 3809 TaxID=551936 RepID=UPI0002FEFA6B|nr:tetratricopeptide repeat protein [Bradyrhizobium sp. STM 3809]